MNITALSVNLGEVVFFKRHCRLNDHRLSFLKTSKAKKSNMDAGAGGESKDSDSEPSTFQREIPPWARGEGLRKVEKDVLIPRIMREKAKVLCKEFVDGKNSID